MRLRNNYADTLPDRPSLMRFPMRKRTRYSLLLMLALMAALVVVIVLRKGRSARGRATAA